jgi:hypothetical protein
LPAVACGWLSGIRRGGRDPRRGPNKPCADPEIKGIDPTARVVASRSAPRATALPPRNILSIGSDNTSGPKVPRNPGGTPVIAP